MIYLDWPEEAWYTWLILIGAMLSLVGSVASCVCGCRRNDNKNEFGGLAGMVTITHPDDGFNRLPTSDGANPVGQDSTDAGKRSSANRSLPDIPKDGSMVEANRVESLARDIIYETNPVPSDTSELYATVEEKNSRQPEVRRSEREIKGNSRKSNANERDAASPYARLKNPSTKADEHPYAQVQNVQKNESSPQSRHTIAHLVDTSVPSSSNHVTNPIAPPRSRKSSSHNSLLASETLPDIQAANAITGGVQANQDLPYMTPPISMPLPEPPHPNQHEGSQHHFSGDSHDSKGYTSISVREPLANIIAQTKAAQQQRQQQRALTDPHYATVSDDSDEMYAAIDEQEKIYTSGSETYAQIQPMVTEVPRVQQSEQVSSTQTTHVEVEAHPSAPQPPSVDSLRHVAHAHSRQASSSSATSSVANLGSPKPEKRQANSPLPPPPESLGDAYASVEKRSSRDERARASVTSGKSLEDMYAKVVKKKRDAEDEAEAIGVSNCHAEAQILPNRKHSLVEVSRASWSSHDSTEVQRKISDASPYPVEPQQSVPAPTSIKSSSKATVPSVTAVTSGPDPGYEVVAASRKSHPVARTASDSDPNYEVLRPQFALDNQHTSSIQRNNVEGGAVYSSPFKKHRQTSNASSGDPGYERVRTRRAIETEDADSEPNYESMPHDMGEPNYASVCRQGDSDADPNYESVSHGDPNYESVEYNSKNEDPPYERVNNYESFANADDYDRINKNNHVDPNYEKINSNRNRDHHLTDGDTDDDQYIQV